MKSKIKTYFNFLVTLLLIAGSVAWMVTVASQGEIVDYNRELIINTLDIDIKIYKYNDETLTYDLVTEPVITINNMAPNDTLAYRIDITNNGDTRASTSIVLANVTGDITALSEKLFFGTTSPIVSKLKLGDVIEDTESGESIIRFVNNYGIDPLQTSSLYWYITLDKTATNEVATKSLTIESINFIKP